MVDQAPTASAGIPDVGATDDERLKGAIAYVLTWLTGILILVMAGESRFLKFHAWQSIVYGVILTIVCVLLSFLCIGTIIGLLGWLYVLYGAYLIYTGKPFYIPVVADFVKNNLMK
ncbi:DUF4870 domain-containing protein [Methanocella conradii]|uniref:DUF4870 domain-containing protein n=1 Tax=Methanocella conradii TaxID=1175444 RepID=UPI00157CCAF3|nr:hypothetical protein [Methanocella conradii]